MAEEAAGQDPGETLGGSLESKGRLCLPGLCSVSGSAQRRAPALRGVFHSDLPLLPHNYQIFCPKGLAQAMELNKNPSKTQSTTSGIWGAVPGAGLLRFLGILQAH